MKLPDEIRERLQLKLEFARPENFVPALAGSDDRHIVSETIGNVSFDHYDPCAQRLPKAVRGFNRDLEDAKGFIDSAYSKYRTLSPQAVCETVDAFFFGTMREPFSSASVSTSQ